MRSRYLCCHIIISLNDRSCGDIINKIVATIQVRSLGLKSNQEPDWTI